MRDLYECLTITIVIYKENFALISKCLDKIKNFKIKNISNLEKITNIFFSNKRKMINKNIKKVLSQDKIKLIPDLKLNARPSALKPEIYYKITELFEKN